MKRLFALLLFLISLGITQEVFASQLPEAEVAIVKQAFPDLKVRFDGLIELSDGTKYIPVYPLKTEFPETSVKLTSTFPKNKSIKDKPDFFMFNTNFAFFKVKKEKDKTTIIYNSAIPTEVKMGLLPQDLLVPRGFQIPSELRIIIGDLIIPITPSKEYKEIVISTGKEFKNSPRATLVEQAAQQLSNKYFYATSFNKNTISILNADTGKAFKQIEFTSIPSDIKLANKGQYLLVSTLRNGNIFVIDTAKTEVLKEIKAGEKPYFIAISNTDNLAYIANRGENSISVIDLISMQPKDSIKVAGNPCYIELSSDGKKLYYLDAITGIVYYLKKEDDYFAPYTSQPLFKSNNIAKIQLVGDKIYTLNRGNNELEIFYINGKPQNENLIDISDITNINLEESVNGEKSAVNYSENESETPFQEDKEKNKLSFKQKINKIVRNLLYYKDEPEIEEQPLNPENQIQVMAIKSQPEEVSAEATKKVKTAKEKLHDFLNYKAEVEPMPQTEQIKLNVEKQMDFIKAKSRANDFLVVNGKIYLLCSDDYIVYVYDETTNKQINSFELEKIGYYNALKTSSDKKIGIITNISSMALTIFDTKTDTIVQKLPLLVNVHNVVITSKK